ncbi:MAG: glycerol-3-phosphate acyltransferase [Oscillospiraceae bacterium]|nr:glycerol-3-phosphate acyltransferase [Oscillospiraceae bacterium]
MEILLCILTGYLLGCLSPAAMFSKLKKKDLRTEGTGNLGATNVTMVLGRKYGAFVLFFDIAKAFIAVKLAQALFPAFIAAGLLAGAAAVAGHIYPFYLKFKGGKGLAAFGGYILGIDPLLFVFLFVFALALMFVINYSAAMPISAAVLFPILYGVRTGCDASVLIVTAVGCLIICKFWSNLVKAIHGEDITVREYVRDHLLAKRRLDKAEVRGNLLADDIKFCD